MSRTAHLGPAVTLLVLTPLLAVARTIPVSTSDELRRAAAVAKPGDVIRLAPGTYTPDLYLANLSGTDGAPITIEGDPNDPPLFRGGKQALHLADCSHLVLRNLVCQGQSLNGLNIDDGGSFDTPARHITLEHVAIRDVGPVGNHDGIKLSGLTDFVLRDCRVEGWAGQAVDMVGCHRGIIESCTFVGKPGFSQATGPQTKGGSADVTFRRCTFVNAGSRALNVGGSTGLPYFRPPDAPHEAARITVEGCTFTGSDAPLAFVGVDGATVRYNTVVRPTKWIFRILQESTDERFAPCRNVTFERNLIVFRHADCPIPLNIGPHTAPETFAFKDNLWFCEDAPQRSESKLPTPEQAGLYTQNPRLDPKTLTPPANSPAARYGHAALP